MFGYKKVSYYSDYSVKDTVKKIHPLVWYLMNPNSSAPLRGTINNQRLGIYKSTMDKIWYKNSFQPTFYGKLSEENGLAVIQGYYSIHRAVAIFLLIVTIGMTASAIAKSSWIFSLVGITTLISLAAFGYWISLGHIEIIERHIKTAIKKQ